MLKKSDLLFSLLISLITLLISGGCEHESVEEDATIPRPEHVMVVFMENHSYEQIVDTTVTAYIHRLISGTNTALLSNYYALGHPSQPNYLEIFSGSNQGVSNNDRPVAKFHTRSLAAQLEEAGFTFCTYSEDLPYVGFDGDAYNNYVRRHNPVTNWVGDGKNQVDSSLNRPFTDLPEDYSDLPTVSFIIPNLQDDMHDGGLIRGDVWLMNHTSGYLDWAKYHNSILIIVFDEGTYTPPDDHVLLLIAGQLVKAGTYDAFADHYSLLRTIEEMYGLDHAGQAATREPISDCWIVRD